MFDISADGTKIATSSDVAASSNIAQASDAEDYGKTTVELWNTSDLLEGKKPYQQTKGAKFDEQFANMSFSHNGEFIAATTISSYLYYWNVKKDTENAHDRAQTVNLHARGQVLAFSPSDPTILAVGLQDSRIQLWSVDDRPLRLIMTIRQLVSCKFKRVLRSGTRPVGAIYIAGASPGCLDPRSVDAIASLSAMAWKGPILLPRRVTRRLPGGANNSGPLFSMD
jgi:WD40 repeat protein